MTPTELPEDDPEDMPESGQAPSDQVTPSNQPVPENDPTPDAQPATKRLNLTPLAATVELLRRGHRELIPRLRELLRQSPDVYRHVGDLGRQSQQAWANMIAGPDHLLRESLLLFAEDLKKDLVGPKATRLEKVAAERIVAAWMEVEYFRMWRVQHPDAEGTKVGELHRKRFEEADRRLERALTSLATIRKLLPRTIEVQVIQKPMTALAPSPVVGGLVNGGVPEADNARAMRFNGVNRIGGKLHGDHGVINETLEHAAVQ